MITNVEHLEFLDTILSYLKHGTRSSCVASTLFEYLEGENISMYKSIEEEFKPTEDFIPLNYFSIDSYKKQLFEEAIVYLRSLELVSTETNNVGETIISLTFKGQVKTTFGFVNEYEKEKEDSELRKRHIETSIGLTRMQRWTIILATTVAVLGFLLSLYSLIKKDSIDSDDKCCDRCQEHNTNPKILGCTDAKVESVSKETSDTIQKFHND